MINSKIPNPDVIFPVEGFDTVTYKEIFVKSKHILYPIEYIYIRK